MPSWALNKEVGTPRKEVRGLGRRAVLRPTPQLWEVPTMTETMPRVGLDVHANQTHMFCLDLASGDELKGRQGKSCRICERSAGT